MVIDEEPLGEGEGWQDWAAFHRVATTDRARYLNIGETKDMSEQPVSVSADDLHAASEQAASWEEAVRRAAHGEKVAVISGGEHVADVVPSGELERLRETIEVLSDTDAVRALSDSEIAVVGRDAIRAIVADRKR